MTAYTSLHFCLVANEKPPMELSEHPELPNFLLSIGKGEAQFTLSGPKDAVRAAVRDLVALFESGHECPTCHRWHDKSEASHG